jgi:hypothetical protein
MNSATNSDSNKKAMINALKKTLGVVAPACELVGIARSTHYRWIEEDKNYKDQIIEILDIQIDFVESKLFENISKNDITSTIFYLKTKGRERGYIEKQEHKHEFEQMPFKPIDLDVITDDSTK